MADVSAEYITQDLLNDICDWMKLGNSIRKFPFSEHGKTDRSFYRWLESCATEEQRQQYARGIEERADAIFEECIEIADNSTDDVIFLTADDKDGEGGKPAIKHSAIARARLMVDTRKWMLGKLQPKKYGEKLALGGADDLPPIKTDGKIEIVHVVPK